MIDVPYTYCKVARPNLDFMGRYSGEQATGMSPWID